jgi:putative ABC transport system substrate-binding protein
MKRREFITLLAGAAAWPVAVRAQQPTKLPTIGYLGAGSPATQSQWAAAFVQRLRQRGWIEGRDVAIEYRWAEGRDERFAEIAAEFVRLGVDVIVTYATPPVLAAKQATWDAHPAAGEKFRPNFLGNSRVFRNHSPIAYSLQIPELIT